MFIGIKDKKVFDICSDLRHKRDPNDVTVKYIESKEGNIFIDDTWEPNHLADSPQRIPIAPEKSPLELKLEALEARLDKLEEVVYVE